MTNYRRNSETTKPQTPAPALFCPSCDRPLHYETTVTGGVSPAERWDYLRCVEHGQFCYRHRTRRLDTVPELSPASRSPRLPRRDAEDD